MGGSCTPIGLVLLALLCCACDAATDSELLRQLSLLYKDTYVVYGVGRRSERHLPVCGSQGEACNLAHRRFWLRPITERLCRCPSRLWCPLDFEDGHASSQHVTNRAQLKFCGSGHGSLGSCAENATCVEFRRRRRRDDDDADDDPAGSERRPSWETRTRVLCRCAWPRQLALVQEQRDQDGLSQNYQCRELPKCKTGELCGHIRSDTYATYYECSCPREHLCVFPRDTNETTHYQGLHFQGRAYKAFCTARLPP